MENRDEAGYPSSVPNISGYNETYQNREDDCRWPNDQNQCKDFDSGDVEQKSCVTSEGNEQLKVETTTGVASLLKNYVDTMAHVFEGYSEVFKQSEEHENFVLDKITKVEKAAEERLKELVKSKEAHFEKLNMLSATLSLEIIPPHS